jgi:hypothetical protein
MLKFMQPGRSSPYSQNHNTGRFTNTCLAMTGAPYVASVNVQFLSPDRRTARILGVYGISAWLKALTD